MQNGLTFRVLFIDDHPIYCEGMALALGRSMPDLAVHTAGDALSASAVLNREDIDLVLCAYRLPGDDGIAVISRLARAHPSVAVGLLCADLTPLLAGRAVAAGAVACLSKERDVASIADALRRVLDGGSVFDANPALAQDHGLTPHRVEILQMAAQGLSNKEIALKLQVTERTIKDHWSTIFARLGASDQRGVSRPASSGCDVGAFEFSGSYQVNTLADTDDGVCDTSHCTLREAINAANASAGVPDAITFNIPSGGTITLGSTLPTISDSGGPLTIQGPTAAADAIAISSNNAVRIMATASGSTLSLDQLTLSDGQAPSCCIFDPDPLAIGPIGRGGGAIVALGAVTLSNCTLSNNQAGGGLNGGAGGAGGATWPSARSRSATARCPITGQASAATAATAATAVRSWPPAPSRSATAP